VKKIFFAVLLAIATLYIFTAPPPAEAQTKYNLATAVFEHTWNQGTGSPAAEWRYSCGPKTGGYTLLTKVTYSAPTSGSLYDVPASVVFSNMPGIYFCVMKAGNAYGDSGPTNEVNGDFGTVPAAGSQLVIKP
jgi:hypothetical protein